MSREDQLEAMCLELLARLGTDLDQRLFEQGQDYCDFIRRFACYRDEETNQLYIVVAMVRGAM